jgi:hypothetical protein
MRAKRALAAIALELSQCGHEPGPGDWGGDPAREGQPNPGPQQPAPNADPKPSGKEAPRKYLKFTLSQDGYTLRYFKYSFRSTDGNVIINPPKEGYLSPMVEKEIEINRPGIAKLTITTDWDVKSVGPMQCIIFYKAGKGSWVVLNQSDGFTFCEASAPVN